MNTLNLLHKISAIIVLVAILGVIFISKGKLFMFLGALGGCVFLIKLVLESAFPKWFENKEKLKDE